MAKYERCEGSFYRRTMSVGDCQDRMVRCSICGRRLVTRPNWTTHEATVPAHKAAPRKGA